jgi:hypothetical protein
MLIPVMKIYFLVGAIPLSSPLWVPRQLQRTATVSPSGKSSAPNIWRRWVMVSVVRAKELVCHLQIALVPNLLEQTTNDSFV